MLVTPVEAISSPGHAAGASRVAAWGVSPSLPSLSSTKSSVPSHYHGSCGPTEAGAARSHPGSIPGLCFPHTKWSPSGFSLPAIPAGGSSAKTSTPPLSKTPFPLKKRLRGIAGARCWRPQSTRVRCKPRVRPGATREAPRSRDRGEAGPAAGGGARRGRGGAAAGPLPLLRAAAGRAWSGPGPGPDPGAGLGHHGPAHPGAPGAGAEPGTLRALALHPPAAQAALPAPALQVPASPPSPSSPSSSSSPCSRARGGAVLEGFGGSCPAPPSPEPCMGRAAVVCAP